MAPCPPERRRQQGVRGAKLIRVVSCGICRRSSHQVSRMRMVPSLAAGAGAGVPLFPGARKTVQRDLPCAGWCHPLRRSGIMVTRRLFGFEARGPKVDLVRAGGLEPPRALRPNGFSYPSTAFAAAFNALADLVRDLACSGGCGVRPHVDKYLFQSRHRQVFLQ